MSNPDRFSDKWLLERTRFRFFLYCLAVISVFLPNYISDDNKRLFAIKDLMDRVNRREQFMRSEARNNIVALNRAQQAYHLEQQKFTYTLDKLGMGIQPETPNYSYRIVQPMAPVSEWKQPQNPANSVMTIARAKDREDGLKIRSYLGYVYTTTAASASGAEEVITQSILCEELAPHLSPTMRPYMVSGQMQCPSSYKELGR